MNVTVHYENTAAVTITVNVTTDWGSSALLALDPNTTVASVLFDVSSPTINLWHPRSVNAMYHVTVTRPDTEQHIQTHAVGFRRFLFFSL